MISALLMLRRVIGIGILVEILRRLGLAFIAVRRHEKAGDLPHG